MCDMWLLFFALLCFLLSVPKHGSVPSMLRDAQTGLRYACATLTSLGKVTLVLQKS